jgi:hypothetical protein
MDLSSDDAFDQALRELKDASFRRATIRAATAHQFLNAVTQARILHDLENIAQERVNTRHPHPFMRIFERVFSSSPYRPHPSTDLIIEAEVISRSSGTAEINESSGQLPVVIVINPSKQSNDDPSHL